HRREAQQAEPGSAEQLSAAVGWVRGRERTGNTPPPVAPAREESGPQDEGGSDDLVGAEMAQQTVENGIGEGHDQRREQDGGPVAAEAVEMEHAQLPEPSVRDPATTGGREGERIHARKVT